jgi:hypothetical protein
MYVAGVSLLERIVNVIKILDNGTGVNTPYGSDMAMPEPTRSADPYDDPYSGSSYHRPRRYSTAAPIMIQPQPSMGGGGVPSVIQASPPSSYATGSVPMTIPGRAASGGTTFSGGLGTTPTYPPPQMSAQYPGRAGSSQYGISAGVPPTAPTYATAGGVPYAGSGSYSSGLPQSYNAGSVLNNPTPTMTAQYPAAGGQYGGQPGYSGSQAVGGTGYGMGGAYQGGMSSVPSQSTGGGYSMTYGGTTIPAQPGQTIVIQSRPRRHSHSHRQYRSRSRDGGRERAYYVSRH